MVLHCELCAVLQKDLEQLDPRGRTPLHLAVTLNRVNCTHLLLFHNATPLAENRHKWSGERGGGGKEARGRERGRRWGGRGSERI